MIAVGPSDLTIVRFTLRHLLRHVPRLHTVYMITRATPQATAIARQTNANFGGSVEGGPKRVVLFDEERFPMSLLSVKEHLKKKRNWNGEICCRDGVPENRLGWYLQQFLKLCVLRCTAPRRAAPRCAAPRRAALCK